MGALYRDGETKVRPGVYRRYVNRGGGIAAGADDGTVAVALQADWGPIGAVTQHENTTSIRDTYGTGGKVAVALKLIEGGTRRVLITRVGKGGTKATAKIGTDAVTITAKYEGKRAFTYSIREKLGDSTVKEFILYEGTSQLERVEFATGGDEGKNLADAINKSSAYFTAEAGAAGDKEIEAATNAEITAGTSPTVNTEDYDEAFEAIESYRFNVLVVDTDDTAVHLLEHSFLKRVTEDGALCIGVVGEPTTVEFETRLSHAAAFNDEKIVYVGGSGKDVNGNIIEGYMAAATVAAAIASTPSNQSIVHKTLSGLVDVGEVLKNTQYTEAIKNGMILFSLNGEGSVWIDSGVNTLITPNSDQDEGWKKIKRVKVRHEIMDRIDRTIAPLVGRINNDANGVANVIKLAQDVIDAMIRENKILAGGTISEDTENPHFGDSAWFVIDVDDIDTMEKIYMKYRFRFSENS